MKLYKFRSLNHYGIDFVETDDGKGIGEIDIDSDFCRLKNILLTGKFWCSQFSDLNDPMEGMFTVSYNSNIDKIIDSVYYEKKSYKICSFSGEQAFSDTLMWGYYGNGFRGVAIEIEVDDDKVKEIQYVEEIPRLEDFRTGNKAEKILTTKLSPWKHENEFRYLTHNSCNLNEIGKITAVYYGDPYEQAYNKTNIIAYSDPIKKYNLLIKEMLKIQNIKFYPVIIRNRKVVVKQFKI
jgi:hypothetical protein